MAGYVPYAWRAVLLEAMAGKTGIATGSLYFGLATAVPDNPYTATLSNITEVVTAGYARKLLPAFGSATTVSPVQLTTPTAFAFNALTADMAIPANFGFLTPISSGVGSGAAGDLRYIFELAEPVLGRNGEALQVAANTLIIE